MLKTENKCPKSLNKQNVNSGDIGLMHIGGTSVLGARKPIAKLEFISSDHDEASLLDFKNDLSLEESERLIESLKSASDDPDEIPLLKFKKELSSEVSEKLIVHLEPIKKDKQEDDSCDPYNSKLGEFVNKFTLENK